MTVRYSRRHFELLFALVNYISKAPAKYSPLFESRSDYRKFHGRIRRIGRLKPLTTSGQLLINIILLDFGDKYHSFLEKSDIIALI